MSATAIKASHKAIVAYYDQIHAYGAQSVEHELALRTAFQSLLAETAKSHHWTLVPELSLKVRGKTIRPDGVLRDDMLLPRGYWEAKDTDDDLDAEIRKKIGRGYPLLNTIFEDTQVGVLFQNGTESYRADLRKPEELANLLNEFYGHVVPDIEGFEQAIGEFQERIPDLAKGLLAKIEAAHQDIPKFQAAFESLMELCRSALNPNIRVAAVDEMLVQHLLTERLFRTVFENADFIKRNVIAAEIEQVIDALVSKSFNRAAFLKSLDPFYKAIESAAATIEDFSAKQHFLNSVYERFFQGYSVKVADTHGIVYTPQAIVDFMCASVEEVLRTEFGRGLGDEGVNILDPCTGTGNFIVNLLRRIDRRDLPRAYRTQLFANEVMLLPYYIAAQNIEHEYFDLTGTYEPFEGMCFVDTLELAEAEQAHLSFMTEENTARVNRQKSTPITVIIGNPPYNIGQLNENDNNKNRKYQVIDGRISQTYARDSKATNKNALSDVYVKFFRWAIDRLQDRDGIVCFVSNNSLVDQIAFDGMRKHLLQDFSRVYHLDLRGNARKNPKLSGTTYNVFGIQVGVGITIAIRSLKHKSHRLYFHRVPEEWRKLKKLAWLGERRSLNGIDWTILLPDERHTWLLSEHADEFTGLIPIGTRAGKAGTGTEDGVIFKLYSSGIKTNRDEVVYDFHAKNLKDGVQQFIESYNAEVDRYHRSISNLVIDEFVNYDKIKWSESLKQNLARERYADYDGSKIRDSLYRPFAIKAVYLDDLLVERRYLIKRIFPTKSVEGENLAVALTAIGSEKPFMALSIKNIADFHLVGAGCGTQCFPFYVYDEDGTNRCENITDWALVKFRHRYSDASITKWDVFYYVYGVLHQPAYREKFADNLKRELPRIPFMADFRAFAEPGKALADLHLNYEQAEPWPLKWIYTEGTPLSYRVEKMRLSKDKTELKVNETLALAGIPPEVFGYRLGNRSALEWVIDQYQVSEDPRSRIKSDPNRKDDPEYIVRLVGQVVRVSVETVSVVSKLPGG